MKKYRIKEENDGLGAWYTVQRRVLFIWWPVYNTSYKSNATDYIDRELAPEREVNIKYIYYP